MRQDEIQSFKVLDNNYYIGGDSPKEGIREEEKFSIQNLVNLLTALIARDIPDTIHLSDSKFIAFQEHMTQIVQKEIAKLKKSEKRND